MNLHYVSIYSWTKYNTVEDYGSHALCYVQAVLYIYIYVCVCVCVCITDLILSCNFPLFVFIEAFVNSFQSVCFQDQSKRSSQKNYVIKSSR